MQKSMQNQSITRSGPGWLQVALLHREVTGLLSSDEGRKDRWEKGVSLCVFVRERERERDGVGREAGRVYRCAPVCVCVTEQVCACIHVMCACVCVYV